jgi:hypothetical protein
MSRTKTYPARLTVEGPRNPPTFGVLQRNGPSISGIEHCATELKERDLFRASEYRRIYGLPDCCLQLLFVIGVNLLHLLLQGDESGSQIFFASKLSLSFFNLRSGILNNQQPIGTNCGVLLGGWGGSWTVLAESHTRKTRAEYFEKTVTHE